ncbi:MAG: hypothetical protein JNL07_09780, partial [Rhodospirillales bacterium]|nr:hypothetical protein [Rhodospirillales bacterium]
MIAHMPTDSQGLAVSNADAAAIAAVDHALEEWLRYGDGLGAYMSFAREARGVPLVQLHAASLNLTMADPAAHAAARGSIDAARGGLRGMNDRERAWLAAMSAWVDGEVDAAARGFDGIVADWPRDLFAAKLGQLLWFDLGAPDRMLR